MPRNDQVTRQWHIVHLLEGSRLGLTLEEMLPGTARATCAYSVR